MMTSDERRAQHSAERALQVSEQRFRSLLENTSGIIAILGPCGSIHYVNPPSILILGYRPEELIGQNLADLVHPQDLTLTVDFLAELQRRPGALLPAEFRIRHRDGSCRLLGVMARSLLDDPGLRGIVFNAQDITERRQLEEQLRQSQKMEAIGRLAGGVAHDFNNMLGAITGYADLLLDRVGSADSVRLPLREILKAAERASTLTRQLLAMSRKEIASIQVIDLNEITTGLHPMLRRLIGEDIELVTLPCPEPAPVKADPTQIEQVLLNLAINARDAMPLGGKLTIGTAQTHSCPEANRGHLATGAQSDGTSHGTTPRAPAPGEGRLAPGDCRLRGPSGKHGDWVTLTVSDTGCGMDAETQSRIFEPFFTTKEEGKGTGLGLATVYGIVQQTGGHIEVQTQPGAGTTFQITLPRSADSPARGEPTSGSWSATAGSETILLVEDEEVLRRLIHEVLRLHGYTVLEALQGDEALRLFQDHPDPVDLLLTDVVMPGMSGRELAQRITSLQPDTRVLFMSGYTDDAMLRSGVLDTRTGFIQKPFKPTALAQKVRETLAAG